MEKWWIQHWALVFGAAALLFLNYQSSILNSASAAEAEPEARVLVKYKSGWRMPTQGGTVVGTIDEIKIRTVQFSSPGEAATAAARLEEDPAVSYAEVNRPSVKPLLIPNDPYYGPSWHLGKVSAQSAWDYQQGSTTTTIAIIDTGVKGTHPDLSGKVLEGKSFVETSPVTLPANSDSDPCGHGTAVAGLAAAVGNNGTGVAGIDWKGQILPVRVIDLATENCDFGFIEDLVEAIRYAADAGAKIISVSLGTGDYSQALRDAVIYAKNRGSMVVAAAGNSSGGILYPAAFPEAIAVGATDSSDNLASFNTPGPELDLVAPGVSVPTTCDSDGSDLSCTSGNPYANFSGTSASAPVVSGALGLTLARNPGMVGNDFITAAQGGVDKLAGMGGANFTTSYGFGRLNVYKLLWAFQDYHAQWVSQNSYPEIPRNGSSQFAVQFKNTGKSSWYRDDPFIQVHLGTDRGRDRVPGFIREDKVAGNSSGWRHANRIFLSEAKVEPGAIGNFYFWYTSPPDKGFGVYREYFRPVADGWGWLEDFGVFWDITVPTPEQAYRHRFLTQNGYPTLKRGESYKFSVTVKNTGPTTWQRGVVNLGTDRGRDRIPGFIREDQVGGNPSGWLKQNRVQLVQTSVAPNSEGTFEFYYTASPDNAFGVYREYFRLVADGITWLEDYGIYWDITVVP